MRPWKALLPVLGVLLTVALVWQARGTRASAASSHVDAAVDRARTLAAVTRVLADGRVATYPGSQVTVGTDVHGTLVRVAVDEKQTVKRGQLLAELRADDLRASIVEARAKVAETDADRKLFALELQRAEKLVAGKVASEDSADLARRNRDAADARHATAAAEVERLEAELAKTRITAPIDGVVISKHAHAGETVDAGAPIVELADLHRLRVEAEVDEFDAGRVALGAPVLVTAEGFAGQRWSGRVEEIPDAVSARRLKPQDPGKPQDTRVLIVKVALDGATPLKLGQRVEVEIGPR